MDNQAKWLQTFNFHIYELEEILLRSYRETVALNLLYEKSKEALAEWLKENPYPKEEEKTDGE